MLHIYFNVELNQTVTKDYSPVVSPKSEVKLDCQLSIETVSATINNDI